MGFEKLKEIIVLNIQYTTKSALAISAGEQPAEIVETPVIKMGGRPVIPGSSLKGAIRSSLESMLAAVGETVCVPFAAIPRSQRRDNEQKQYLKKLGRSAPCENVSNPCPVCTIFGTVGGQTGLSGKAIVLDAKAREGAYDLIERSHVAITRDTKSQAEGSLMSLQAVDAGTIFSGNIRIVNPDDWQVGAIALALQGVARLGIGAKKTSGYGELDIAIVSVEKHIFNGSEWDIQTAKLDTYLGAFRDKFRK